MIPLSDAAILGGSCILISTSTNILVDGVVRAAGLAPPAAVVALASGVYLLLVQHLLPKRMGLAAPFRASIEPRFIVEVVVEAGSPAVAAFTRFGRTPVDMVRGKVSLRRELGSVQLAAGDVVVLTSPTAEILSVKEAGELKPPPEEGLQRIGARRAAVVEILLVPGAGLLGRTLAEPRLRRRYGVYLASRSRRPASSASSSARSRRDSPACRRSSRSALTEIVTNNAVAVVLTPVAMALALQLGVDPRPFVVAVSASFATPIGYQTNTLVHAGGGYRFADFLRFGLPMNLLVGLLSVPRIPLICLF